MQSLIVLQAPPKKPFPVPPDLSPLFNACAILLNQRILLASEGLRLEDFYFQPLPRPGSEQPSEAPSSGSRGEGSSVTDQKQQVERPSKAL